MERDIMGTFSKITSKGQVTIPKDIREKLNLKEGDVIAFVPTREGVLIIPRNRPAESLFGMLAEYAIPGTSLADYDDAIGEAIADHVEGKRLKRTDTAA
jgi:antitoxin PrlF